jgi:hypothetical protein
MSHKFTFRVALVTALLALLIAAPSAFAGKGGKPGGGGGTTTTGSSLTLVLLDSTDGVAHQGQRVTFNVTTSNTRPFVRVDCYSGSTWIYTASAGFFPDYPWSKEFPLSSSAWTSGAADCTATMYTSTDGTRVTNLATLRFHVNA